MNANYKSIILAISSLFALSTSISAAPGDLDPTFGNGGIVITRGDGINHLDTALGMAIQPDGKIVVVGDGNLGNRDFAVIRYNTDGSLDSSFGGGIVLTSVSNFHDLATSVAIQADGKIVVAGIGGTNLAVVRYNTNGSLDTSFNGTGIVINPVDSNSGFANVDVAIQEDGKIVAARGGNVLIRYNTNGSLDTSFNGTGIVFTQGSDVASSIAIQADGKIVAVGGSQNSFAVARYNTNGSPDTSFNGTGRVITPVGNSSLAVELAIQSDGKIVVAGESRIVTDDFRTADFAVVRYNPNGSLDTSFGGAGKVIISFGNFIEFVSSVAIQPDGKIVVAGTLRNNNGLGSNFAVARFNPNGSLDTTFNGTGKVTTAFCCQDFTGDVAIQSDGKIVLLGSTDDLLFDFYDFVVVRYQGDDATPAACPNSIDCAEFFVRQHYPDFLSREPDAPGLAFWTNEIAACGADAACREVKRVNVSAAFFLSVENQETGYLAHRAYKVAYGDLPGKPVPLTLQEYLAGGRSIGDGVQVGVGDWRGRLAENKAAFFNEFVRTARFTSLYPEGGDAAFVDALNRNAGGALSQAERDFLIELLGHGNVSIAEAVWFVCEDRDFVAAEKNRAFVLAQYFGYLRRNPDDIGFDGQPDPNFEGYTFWLDKLNQFNGNFVEAEMVKAFLDSAEYRRRFGQD